MAEGKERNIAVEAAQNEANDGRVDRGARIAGEAASLASGALDESLNGLLSDLEARATDSSVPAEAQNAALQIIATLRAQISASVAQAAQKAVDVNVITQEEAKKYTPQEEKAQEQPAAAVQAEPKQAAGVISPETIAKQLEKLREPGSGTSRGAA